VNTVGNSGEKFAMFWGVYAQVTGSLESACAVSFIAL